MASSPQPPLLPLPPAAVASLVKTSILTGIPTPPFTPQRTNLEFDSFHRLSNLYSLGGTVQVNALSPRRIPTARRRAGQGACSEETHGPATSSPGPPGSPTNWRGQGRRRCIEESAFMAWHRRQKYRKALLTDVLGIDPPSAASQWERERSRSRLSSYAAVNGSAAWRERKENARHFVPAAINSPFAAKAVARGVGSRRGPLGGECTLAPGCCCADCSDLVVEARRKRMGEKKISKHPYRELEAPGLPDDFYLNLLSWSSRDIVAAATGSTVTLWGPERTPRQLVLKQEGERRAEVTHLSFCPQDASLLLLGFRDGETALFDANKGCKVRSLAGHRSRCAVAAWGRGGRALVATGSKDHSILYRDVRSPEPFVLAFLRHQSEVCGIDVSSSERLLASGGNDNLLCVWDVRKAALPKPWTASSCEERLVVESLPESATGGESRSPFVAQRSEETRVPFRFEGGVASAMQLLRRSPQLALSQLGSTALRDLREIAGGGRVDWRDLESLASTEETMLSALLEAPSSLAGLRSRSQETASQSQPEFSPSETVEFSSEGAGLSSTAEISAGPSSLFRVAALVSPALSRSHVFPTSLECSQRTQPLFVYEEHCAAVKAVRFCCHSDGLLASGGGTADRHIRFWNTNLGIEKSVFSFDSGCQVCNVCFSRHSHEFVSTHGFSLNQIFVWNYKPFALNATPPAQRSSGGGSPLLDSLVGASSFLEDDAGESLVEKTATLSGHSARVLFFSESPCGTRIVTGAGKGDELLKFWEIFPNKPSFASGIAEESSE